MYHTKHLKEKTDACKFLLSFTSPSSQGGKGDEGRGTCTLSPSPKRMRDSSLPSVPRGARIRKGQVKVNPLGGHRTGNATIKVEILRLMKIRSAYQLQSPSRNRPSFESLPQQLGRF